MIQFVLLFLFRFVLNLGWTQTKNVTLHYLNVYSIIKNIFIFLKILLLLPPLSLSPLPSLPLLINTIVISTNTKNSLGTSSCLFVYLCHATTTTCRWLKLFFFFLLHPFRCCHYSSCSCVVAMLLLLLLRLSIIIIIIIMMMMIMIMPMNIKFAVHCSVFVQF